MKWMIFIILLTFILSSHAFIVDRCQIIDKSGSYTLVTDLAGAQNEFRFGEAYLSACIIVKANNIDINCNGHTLTSANKQLASGIYVDGASEVSIRNCNFNSFDASPNSYGISASSADYLNIYDNQFSNNYAAIFIKDSTFVSIESNVITNNSARGINIINVNKTKISLNNISTNFQEGLLVFQSGGINISHNRISLSNPGISISESDNLLLEKNEFFANSGDGVELYNISNSQIKYNELYSNKHGVYILYSTGISSVNNNIYNNKIGMQMDSSEASTADDVFYKNDQDFVILASRQNPGILNMQRAVFDEPNKKRTLKISITDEANEPYYLKGTYLPAPALPNYLPVSDRYLQITAGALLFIDHIQFENENIGSNTTILNFKNGAWQEIPSAILENPAKATLQYIRNNGTYGLFDGSKTLSKINGNVQLTCNYSKITLTVNDAPLSDAYVAIGDLKQYSNANGIAEINNCGKISAEKEGFVGFTYEPSESECSCLQGEQKNNTQNPVEKPSYRFEFFDVSPEAFSVRVLENNNFCTNCTIQITEPKGTVANMQTDIDGIVKIKTPKYGQYLFAISKNGSEEINTFDFETRSESTSSNTTLFIIILILIAIAAVIIYYRQKTSKRLK